jgi:hypothetical protein
MNALTPRSAQTLIGWTTRSVKFNHHFGDVAAHSVAIRNLPAAQLFSDGSRLCAVSLAATGEGV